ncbi:MAG TPA: DsrE family protein [Thermoanaerobaculia bacterium]|nr:DsrE family protein [Thermoanaerobaculia bacterium]
MNYLFVLNDPPYGTERTYNGLRLAHNLVSKHEGERVVVFLMGDAAAAGKAGQKTPNGYYNLERMLEAIVARGGEVLACGTCMAARGLEAGELVEGCAKSTLDELGRRTVAADRVLVF